MKASANVDEAFKKIKTATGVNDVQELVHKFLNRESTYSELLVAVADSENRIDLLKTESEDLRKRLHELKIGAEGAGEENDEIVQLRKHQETIRKEDSLKKEKYYNVEIINDLITGWAKRVAPKVDETLTDEKVHDTGIVELFKMICDKVCESLQQLQDEPAQKNNLMNDFLTDDFVNKNIRVRPTSGKTQDEGKEMRSYGSKAHMKEETQDDINDEQLLTMELEDQRTKVKNIAKEKEEELVRKMKQMEKDQKK